MKLNRKTLVHSIICSIIFLVVMMVFVTLNYIDFGVVQVIYLPIWAIAIAAILFGQYIFSYIFITAAALGLTIEYIIHVYQEYPTMKGAFANTLFICLGFIVGVVVQIVVKRARNKREASAANTLSKSCVGK